MEFAGLTLLGFSLVQFTGEALGGLLGQLPGGVAGNVAHDLARLGLGSLRERARAGRLGANHDLQRAVFFSPLHQAAGQA
jgi:hypothetical protein